MNILNKVALQGLKRNRTQTIVTIIGVVLSAVMITAVATFAVSLQNYMINGAIMKYGNWHVELPDVNSSFIQDQIQNDKVSNVAAFENIGYAPLAEGKNPDKPYLFIAGFNDDAFNTLPANLISGRLPENSKEILVPTHIAANGRVKILIGDTLSLVVGDRTSGHDNLNQHNPYASEKETLVPKDAKTYTVVGICERPAFEESTAPGYTLITKTDSENFKNSFSTFVTLKNPGDVHSYASSVNSTYIFNDDVLRFMGLSDDNTFNNLLYSVGGILLILIMLGSIFLIYNSFTISLSDRMRQFGILLSVGATEKQLRNSVLFESLCIGAIGIPIGILIGIPSIQFVISLVAKNFSNVMYDAVPLTLCISIPAIVSAAVISIITILISAYIPARKASGTPVMECIRQSNEVKLESKAVKTSRFLERIYGFDGTLALKNFKRNKRRYRSIILSLTLSVVLFVSASAFGTCLKQAAEKSAVEMDGDISFYTKGMSEDELFKLYDNMKTADGVYTSTYQAISTYSCDAPISDFTADFRNYYRDKSATDDANETAKLSMDVQFIEESIYLDFIKSLGLPSNEYIGEDSKIIVVGKKTSDIDMFASRSMDFTLSSESKEQTKTINATFVDSYPLDPLPKDSAEQKNYVLTAVVPYQMKSQFDELGEPDKMGLTFWSNNPELSMTQMQTMIDAASITADYDIYNLHKILEENRNILFIVNLFTVVFVIMITLIAVANVFNTISTNIRLRRRELAMLRSVGMSDRDFNKMMRFECFLYGFRTLLFGFPIAGIFSWLIYKGMFAGGAEINFIFPWVSIGISMFGVFLVIFITTLYAVGKIKKENIIDALRDEMT